MPFISLDDRRRHLYLIGKTGTGKSTLLQNFIDDDLASGRGFALLDPHGDLADTIANKIPEHRFYDAIYLDPTSRTHAFAYNPLENVPPHQRPLVAAQILASFKAVWGSSWGPRMDYILSSSLRLLLDTPSTLLGLPRLLHDAKYRKRLVARCEDPVVRAYWQIEFASYDDRFRREAISPIENKIGALLGRPAIRNILGQERSTLHIEQIMNGGKILLANLSKGRMGADPSNLLGSLLISAFSQAAERRASIEEQDRVDFSLYVDEFQNFATDTFAEVLSEARKMRLNIVLAHQFLSQLHSAGADNPDLLRDAVFGNVGTMIAFRVGAIDAPILAKELDWNPRDLIDLANYTARMRTIRNGVPQNTALIRTDLPHPSLGTMKKVKANSNARHARPLDQVNADINSFLTS